MHALFAYMPGHREANYPLSDNSTSSVLGIVYFVIHLFRMSLFFVIAGFFARLLHQRLGSWGLIKNRLRRIGLPLIAFLVVTMPLVVIAIIWGARQLGIRAPSKFEFPFPIIGPPVPWGHLWFLYMLVVLCVLVVVVRAAVVRFDTAGSLRAAIGDVLEWSFRHRLAPILLAMPVALSLYGATWWVQWQGVPSPLAGLLPNLPSVLAYGGAFLLGWFLHRRQDTLTVIAGDWRLYLAGAIAGTALALHLIGITPRLAVVPMAAMERAMYLGAYFVAQWCAVFCAMGLAMRFLAAPSARLRYLADASYWMYLVHLPIVTLLQAWMLSWPLHWSLKMLLILGITSVLLLASYHYLVRPTLMGVFLNGRKYAGNPPSDSSSSNATGSVAD